MIITIDGPTASGKSEISRRLAKDLDYMYLNTGLLYRIFGFCLVNEYGYDKEGLGFPKQKDIDFVKDSKFIKYIYDKTFGASIIYKGENITKRLKLPDVDAWSSIVSANPNVRKALLKIQRDLANVNDIIVEGRDCGTVIFPKADYKFFITASDEIRAKRWQKDQIKRGLDVSFEEAINALKERDERDTKRAIAPLKIPKDAKIIDSSNFNLDETINIIKDYLK